MNMLNTEILILIGGVFHLGILIASAQVPGALDWKRHLAPLPGFLRTLFWVYGAFIVLTILGFGGLSLLFAGELAGGSGLARGFCGFVSLFWTARLGVQLFVFDGKELVKTRFHRVGYHILTGVFVLLPLIYGYKKLYFSPRLKRPKTESPALRKRTRRGLGNLLT